MAAPHPLFEVRGTRLRFVALAMTAAGVLTATSCTGSISSTGDDPSGGSTLPGDPKRPSSGGSPTAPTAPPSTPPVAASCKQPQVGRSPLRRLTNFEYDNTLRDLFSGVDIGRPSADANLPGDNVLNTFDNEAENQRVVQAVAEGFFRSAELVAARALNGPDALPRLLGCDPAKDGEDACAKTFITGFGRRAFRRPLEAAETERLQRLFAASKAADGFAGAVRATLERILQSPQVLYRLERAEAGVSKVTPHEMASRLSYTFWGTMPDAELFAAADSGRLADAAEVRKQSERLFTSPRAREALGRLFAQWLRLDVIPDVMKDDTLFPMWNAALKARLVQETTRLTEHVTFDSALPWNDLFTAKYSFMDESLARFHGKTDGPKGSTFARVDLDPSRAAGVLAHAGILALGADASVPIAIFRGLYVRERVLCEHLPPPPANLEIGALPDVDPKVSSRERNAMHSSDPVCASCHKLIDPIGYGFEHFDAVGRWRTDDAGRPIDDSGEIVGGGDTEGPFRGVAELGKKLGGSRAARACLVENVFRFSFGRQADPTRDRCTTDAFEKALDRSGGSLKELLLELPFTDAFAYLTTGGN